MVTTNSEEYRAIDYLMSQQAEEYDLGVQCQMAFAEIMRRLAPILKYIATEHIPTQNAILTKAVAVIKTSDLDVILDWRGKFQQKNSDGLYEIMQDDGWLYLPFVSMLIGLRDALVIAEERKRKHMESLAERHAFVEGILNLFQQVK